MEIVVLGNQNTGIVDIGKRTVLKGLHAGREFAYDVTNGRRFGAGLMIQQTGNPLQEPFILVQNSYGTRLWQFPGGALDKQSRSTELRHGLDGIPYDRKAYYETSMREASEELKGYPVENLINPRLVTFSYYPDSSGRDLYGVVRAETVDIRADLGKMIRTSNELGAIALATLNDLDSILTHHPVIKVAELLVESSL